MQKFLTSSLLPAFMLAVWPASASSILITLDELGHQTVQFPGGILTGTGVMAVDFEVGGLASVLSYDLGGPVSINIGDVVMSEPSTGGISDVIRFTDRPGLGLDAVRAFFYSDREDGFGDLADVGLPTDTLHNCNPSSPECTMQTLVTVDEVGPENVNGVFYTPAANQPGFVPGSSVTYHIVSDTPEPGSTSMMMIAGVFILVSGRCLRRRA